MTPPAPHENRREIRHEQWRPVVGFEDWYEASDHGRVRRIKGGHATHAGRFLNPFLWGEYMGVAISVQALGHQKKHYLHDIVTAAFLGPKPEGHTVNHKNMDRFDNRLANLEYLTHAENIQHGLHHKGGVKLDAEQVRDIRSRYGQGETNKAIAREYGLHPDTIWQIGSGRTWSHLPQEDAA